MDADTSEASTIVAHHKATPSPSGSHVPTIPITKHTHTPADGRVARSHRTIEHIVRALLDLLEQEGDLRPTAHRVARRAGVSRRALYLHFESLEALFAAATDRRVREVFATWEHPPLDRSVTERIDWFTSRWPLLLEALTPLRRATAVHEPFSEEVSATLERTRQWARDMVERTFQPELTAVDDEERRDLTVALWHITSASAWEDLRRQGIGVDGAQRSMARLLRVLFVCQAPG